jgi:hypothetical protein
MQIVTPQSFGIDTKFNLSDLVKPIVRDKRINNLIKYQSLADLSTAKTYVNQISGETKLESDLTPEDLSSGNWIYTPSERDIRGVEMGIDPDEAGNMALAELGKLDTGSMINVMFPQLKARSMSAAKENLKLLPEARTAFAKYNQGLAMFNKNYRDESKAIEAYDMMAQGAEEYFNVVGDKLNLPNFSALMNAKARDESQSNTNKNQMIKFKENALKQIDSIVDKVVKTRKIAFDGAMQLARAKSLMSGIVSNSDDPAALFAGVKILSNVIEPGLAVTEGEVRGYAGDNSITEIMTTMRALINALPGIGGKSVDEVQQEARKANPMQIKQIQKLFNTMVPKIDDTYNNLLTAGSNEIESIIKNDIVGVYGGAIDQNIIDDLVSNGKAKLQMYLNANAGKIELPKIEEDEDKRESVATETVNLGGGKTATVQQKGGKNNTKTESDKNNRKTQSEAAFDALFN